MEDIILFKLNAVNENYRAVVSTFIQWYTFFWTLNAAALAWIFGKTRRGEHVASFQSGIAWMFAILNLLGVGTCWFTWGAVNDLAGQATALIAAKADGHVLQSVLLQPPMPLGFVRYGFPTCMGSVTMMGIAWVVLAMRSAADARRHASSPQHPS